MLDAIQEFLRTSVFADLRVKNRNKMLEAITTACLQILYEGERGILDRFVERRALVERWMQTEKESALDLLREPVHRVQLAVDIFTSMSDQEVYDFTGLEAI